MLLGQFEQRLDDKNRLTLPARLRERFGAGVVSARGFDGCIWIWPRDAWEGYVNAQGERLDPLTAEGRAMQRYLYGGAHEGDLDRQGRLALPAPLVAHARLERDIVVAGLRDRLEVWDRDAWHRQLAEVEGSAEDVAERLAHRRP